MESTIQCLRCYKSIPIRPEMLGQTILCPSCLERVFVHDRSSPQPKQTPNTGSADQTSQPLRRETGRSKREEASPSSSPVGLIVGLAAGLAILLLVVGIAIVAF